ncbi:MAG: hypothetical protein AAF938_05340 [Myxococcota bacterium]
MTSSRVAVLAICAVLLAACGDDDGSGSDGGADTGAPTLRCGDECQTAAARCGAPPGAADGICADICGASPTQSQIRCLSTTDCGSLQAALSGGTVCGIGAEDPGAMDAGTMDVGGAVDSGGATDSGGSCEIGDRACRSDTQAFRCDEIAGRALPTTESCGSGSVCSFGWCVDPAGFGPGSTCARNSECQAPGVCEGSDGLGNAGCCLPPDEVCTADEDCCEGRCRNTPFDFRSCQ